MTSNACAMATAVHQCACAASLCAGSTCVVELLRAVVSVGVDVGVEVFGAWLQSMARLSLAPVR